jgi:deoxyribodipyrimidine photo-lyase
MNQVTPTRTAGLTALQRFVPHAGRAYTARRNYDFGPGRHDAVSQLSPYIRHRLVTEEEVLEAVLARHSAKSAEKFVMEVFWRTYWKGWLEMRPSVWTMYRTEVLRALDQVQVQAGLRAEWEAACRGDTGIACFDAWARELAETGYLHNHARMWFASIWVFTLRLPWALGADFFLRHLLDGDPASNTLSWRWVAGLQTKGKNYIARAANISKYTEGRFELPPGVLDTQAPPLDGPPHPPRMSPPVPQSFDPALPTALVLHEEDLAPGWLFEAGLSPVATCLLPPSKGLTPLQMAQRVLDFRDDAMRDVRSRWGDRLGPVTGDAEDIATWARDMGATQIVTPYAPTGPVAEQLDAITGMTVIRTLRGYDARAWPHATAGFFKFKEKIPRLLGEIRGLQAV